MPYLVTLIIKPSKSSPTRSSMHFTFFHSIRPPSATWSSVGVGMWLRLDRPRRREGEILSLRFAGDLLSQFLVRAGRDVNVLRNLNSPRTLSGPIMRPPVGLKLHALDRQSPHAERI